MPPKLRQRLIKAVLYHERKKFQYFFASGLSSIAAPVKFTNQVLSQLQTQLFRKGEIILERDKAVNDLVLISEGECSLYGFSNCID